MSESSTQDSSLSNGASAPSPTSLDEARNTRAVLMAFRSAIRDGSYSGASATDVAKGLAFLDAVIAQTGALIDSMKAQS